MVPEDGLEPSRGHAPRDFKSLVSTNSTTQAFESWTLRQDQMSILMMGAGMPTSQNI